MGGFDPSKRRRSRVNGLEAHHRAGDPLDEAVILFENVVEIFDLPDRDGLPCTGELQDYVHSLNAGQIGTALVDDDQVRHTVRANGALEETPGSGQIATLGQRDVVWFPAGEKHWHGATPDTAMSHTAIQETIEGTAVTWMEKVTDSEYTDRQ